MAMPNSRPARNKVRFLPVDSAAHNSHTPGVAQSTTNCVACADNPNTAGLSDMKAKTVQADSPASTPNSLRPSRNTKMLVKLLTTTNVKCTPAGVCPKTAMPAAYAKYVPGSFML